MVDLKIKLPAGFTEEEIRGGYTVTRKMKEVWAVELDLLAEFDRVCKKYGIKYFMDSGTLLGAVRSEGFIPWDDDIDVIVLREEYEKLKAIGSDEFKNPYFFQTAYTDKQYFRGHAQLRNSNTLGRLKSEKWATFNQGIFIDIFVLDGVGNEEEIAEQFAKKKQILDKEYKLFSPNSSDIFKRTVKKTLSLIFRKHSLNLFSKYECECQRFNDSPYVDKIMFRNTTDSVKRINREWFNSSVPLKFEFLQIPAPRDYDKILSIYYGKDYMIPKAAPTEHGGVIFDTGLSYKM